MISVTTFKTYINSKFLTAHRNTSIYFEFACDTLPRAISVTSIRRRTRFARDFILEKPDTTRTAIINPKFPTLGAKLWSPVRFAKRGLPAIQAPCPPWELTIWGDYYVGDYY